MVSARSGHRNCTGRTTGMSDSAKAWLALALSVAALFIALYHHHNGSGKVHLG